MRGSQQLTSPGVPAAVVDVDEAVEESAGGVAQPAVAVAAVAAVGSSGGAGCSCGCGEQARGGSCVGVLRGRAQHRLCHRALGGEVKIKNCKSQKDKLIPLAAGCPENGRQAGSSVRVAGRHV